MNKLIITRWNGRLLTALIDGNGQGQNEILELNLEDQESLLGNIYVGKVMHVVPNLNAAFVDFEKDRTGYYSLTEGPGKLKAGNEMIVQVARDAVKTKDPVLTANLNFTGKYAVLTVGKPMISFSSKISDKDWKDALRKELSALMPEAEGAERKVGVIIRTNAYTVDTARIIEDVTRLLAEYHKLKAEAPYRSCYSLLYQAQAGYISSIKNCPNGLLEEILTDEPAVYQELTDYLSHYQPELLPLLRLYQDSMVSPAKLYSLDTAIIHAAQKHVWLKSGGYLVIEQTEAMVVIDVNTGKYSGNKSQEDTVRKINLEAAQEICHQLRLRNLSGIIIIDFIDMKAEVDKSILLEALKTYAKKDPVKTTVVGMTSLNLVEMTRKKGRKPLSEQLHTNKQSDHGRKISRGEES